MLTCPECNRVQHPVCGKPTCVCRTSIPAGELPQRWRFMWGRMEIPRWLFKALWRARPGGMLYELNACPYCGFSETVDYWFERSMGE